MVRDAGTVRFVVLELRPTTPPPGPSRVTVQVLEVLGARLPGAHVREVMPVTAVIPTVPPVPVTAISSPAGDAPRLLLMVTGRRCCPKGSLTGWRRLHRRSGSEFNPQATQV